MVVIGLEVTGVLDQRAITPYLKYVAGLLIASAVPLASASCGLSSTVKGQPFQLERPKIVAAQDVNDEQEQRLGNYLDAWIQRSVSILDDEHYLSRTINRIVQRLRNENDRSSLKYRIRVINQPKVVNAQVVPGGFIYVWTGLLHFVDSEDELAAVLAHEIAHNEARHWIEEARRKQQLDVIVKFAADLAGAAAETAIGRAVPRTPTGAAMRDVGTRFGGAMATGVAGEVGDLLATLILRAYDRDQEREADELAIKYLERAEYRVEAVSTFFCRFQDLAAREGLDSGGLFSTHPSPEERCKTNRR